MVLSQNEPVDFMEKLVPGMGETAERVGSGFERVRCGSACKKDPLSGVIGVQQGPLISMV